MWIRANMIRKKHNTRAIPSATVTLFWFHRVSSHRTDATSAWARTCNRHLHKYMTQNNWRSQRRRLDRWVRSGCTVQQVSSLATRPVSWLPGSVSLRRQDGVHWCWRWTTSWFDRVKASWWGAPSTSSHLAVLVPTGWCLSTRCSGRRVPGPDRWPCRRRWAASTVPSWPAGRTWVGEPL